MNINSVVSDQVLNNLKNNERKLEFIKQQTNRKLDQTEFYWNLHQKSEIENMSTQ